MASSTQKCAVVRWLNDNNRVSVHEVKYLLNPQPTYTRGDEGLSCSPGYPGKWEYRILELRGVHFRPFALSAAKERNLKGWVKNTQRGAIYGVIQGNKAGVEDMKRWLVTGGPPRGVIQGCLFTNERELVHAEYPHFTIEPNNW